MDKSVLVWQETVVLPTYNIGTRKKIHVSWRKGYTRVVAAPCTLMQLLRK
jgi:hypothetical protein